MGKVQVEADIPQVVNYVATTVNVGTTTTLPSGSDATVTNSGTESNSILNFGIPKGADGKSAYEQAVEGGYEGTEEEFEAALASDIATVASNISDVNAVGQSISDVNSVADSLTNISTVATNVSDVNTVAGISSDVTSVASISSAVSTVASHDTEVLLVSDNMASVMTTASNIGDVSAVAGISSNISTVAGISSDIEAVADNATDISSVAANNTNITAVANNETNINAVNANKTNIDTVATNISSVNTAATNMAAIIAAPTAATNAATSATNAQKWAEGTDSQVAPLGGEHSAKGWANIAKQYAESIGAALKYKGSVSTYSALPSTGQEIGDTWNVLDTGDNYAWTGTEWDKLSGTVDLSAYRTAAAQDLIDATKQDTLVSGTNIKTVNGNSLLGSGNININALPSQTGQSGKFLTTDGTDASWASVSIPANVYTQDNLIAGNDISLTDVSDIDSDTMMLMHFNESLADSSLYNADFEQKTLSGTTWTANPTYVDGRFGKACGALNPSISSPTFTNPIFSQLNDEITVDFWFYYNTSSVNDYVCQMDFTNLSGSKIFGIEIYHYNGTFNIRIPATTGNMADAQYLTANAWNHFALNLKSRTNSQLFINGHLIGTYTSYPPNFSAGIGEIMFQNGNLKNMDELRVSKVKRYNDSFDAPTAPYGQPTGQKKINCILDISGKQDTLVSGTNIKTINSNSLLGSGNITIDSLPSQTGQSGKYLTTNGSTASWAAVPAGLSADGTTIQNTSNVLSTIAVKDQQSANAIKVWTGTLAQYNALVSGGTIDSNTLYNITDDEAAGGYTFDDTLDANSTNAVQNKTLYAVIGDVETLINAL